MKKDSGFFQDFQVDFFRLLFWEIWLFEEDAEVLTHINDENNAS